MSKGTQQETKFLVEKWVNSCVKRFLRKFFFSNEQKENFSS
jgi:hypothetical protein